MTFATFLRFSDILGFATKTKKTKKNTYRVTKIKKCHKFRNCDIVTFGNVRQSGSGYSKRGGGNTLQQIAFGLWETRTGCRDMSP